MKTIEQQIEEVRRDRRKARSDPEARIFRDEFHDFFDGCSRDELVDLIGELIMDDPKAKGCNLEKLAQEKLDDILVSRYLNRHPEEL